MFPYVIGSLCCAHCKKSTYLGSFFCWGSNPAPDHTQSKGTGNRNRVYSDQANHLSTSLLSSVKILRLGEFYHKAILTWKWSTKAF